MTWTQTAGNVPPPRICGNVKTQRVYFTAPMGRGLGIPWDLFVVDKIIGIGYDLSELGLNPNGTQLVKRVLGYDIYMEPVYEICPYTGKPVADIYDVVGKEYSPAQFLQELSTQGLSRLNARTLNYGELSMSSEYRVVFQECNINSADILKIMYAHRDEVEPIWWPTCFNTDGHDHINITDKLIDQELPTCAGLLFEMCDGKKVEGGSPRARTQVSASNEEFIVYAPPEGLKLKEMHLGPGHVLSFPIGIFGWTVYNDGQDPEEMDRAVAALKKLDQSMSKVKIIDI